MINKTIIMMSGMTKNDDANRLIKIKDYLYEWIIL